MAKGKTAVLDLTNGYTKHLAIENEVFREALQKIRVGNEDCACDHTDEDCCNVVGEYCPFCIAELALNLVAAK